MKYFSINCKGFSTFLKTSKDLNENDSDDVVEEAIKTNLMDSDDAKLVFNMGAFFHCRDLKSGYISISSNNEVHNGI